MEARRDSVQVTEANDTMMPPRFIFEPIAPSRIRRYDPSRRVKEGIREHPIKPFSYSSIENSQRSPPGWGRFIHPEGLPYFVRFYRHPQNPLLGRVKVITNEWLYSSGTCQVIEKVIANLPDIFPDIFPIQRDTYDLFIELHRDSDGLLLSDDWDEDETIFGDYYFADHSRRRIFWIEEVKLNDEVSELFSNVRGEISEIQVEMCLEAEYWTNWENFPALQELTLEIYDYVSESILDAMTNVVISDASAFGYTYEELQKRLEILRVAKEFRSSTWHIGSFMKEIISERLKNHHGTSCPRVTVTQAVLFTGPEEHSILKTLISSLLFFMPDAQRQRMRMVIVDQTVNMPQWNKLLDQLLDEWYNTILISTIILAANCAFLAIPLFQSSEFPDTHSSPEQILSYLSLNSSLLGLVLAMVTYQHHKTRRPHEEHELEHYLYGQNKNKLPSTHIQHLYFVWSLPQALVLWSVLLFTTAFLLMCFLGSLTAARAAIASSTGFLGCLTLYFAIVFGGGRDLMRSWCTCLVGPFSGLKLEKCKHFTTMLEGGWAIMRSWFACLVRIFNGIKSRKRKPKTNELPLAT